MQERVQSQLETLLDHGREVMNSTAFGGSLNQDQFQLAQNRYQEFKTRALNLIRRVCGSDSDHYLQLRELGGEREYTGYGACVGIVEAAQHDFSEGLLFDMKALIAAELLGDFIEQAESLLANNYHIPAASLAGAVLEDTLRKLWIKNNWEVPQKTNINSLNSELAKKGVYSSLIQKQIIAYATLRNNADHGHYEEVKKEDADDLIKWVRRFAADHLG